MSKNDTIEIMDVNDVRQFGQEFSYSKRVIEAGIWLIRNGWGDYLPSNVYRRLWQQYQCHFG